MLGSDIRLEGFGEAMEQSHTPEEEEAMLLEAVNAAKEAEVVVLAIGEDRLQSGEATSNANIRIPEIQQRLLERVSEVNEKRCRCPLQRPSARPARCRIESKSRS